jgi:nitroreductase
MGGVKTMELMEVIKKRRSVRAYKEKPLPKSVVADILDAARYAPSARNLQPLQYKVITNKTLIKRLSDGVTEALKGQGLSLKAPPTVQHNYFYSAPLLIIIVAPKENTFAISDAALAVQNIMLYATSINLGSCFIGMARLLQHSEKLMKELHIGEDMNILAAVICGYPEGWPEEKEKKLNAEFFE